MVMKKLVVIPFNVPWNWSTDYLNQTAFELSKNGNIVVCYLWGDTGYIKESFHSGKFQKLVSKYSKNIYLINPIYPIPFRRFKFIRNVNSSLNILFLRLFTEIISVFRRCKKKIFWIFDPNLIFIYKYFGYKYFLLYDCVDFFSGPYESRLCKIADLIVANSHVLQYHLSKLRKDVTLVPQGFRIEDFANIKYKETKLNLKRPIIGFVGGINKRLDFDLLFPLVRDNPNWNFVMWGPLQEKEKFNNIDWSKMQKLISLPNLTRGESVDKREIPRIISQFDIGMIPYDISQDFNKYCFPMKLFEYLYLGKPVVSTNIIELERFQKFVEIGDSAIEWKKNIKRFLSKRLTEKEIKIQRTLAGQNSWQNKITKTLYLCETTK
jgi:glycosyltransferase involved in cell wall biosynthesis